MAFTQESFGPISSHGNSNMPNIWTYRTNDTSTEVSSPGYFEDKTSLLNDGDFFVLDASDGAFQGYFRFSAGKVAVSLMGSSEGKAFIVLESTTTQTISTDQANPTVLDNWVVLKSNLISLQGSSIRNDSGRDIDVMHGTIGIHPQVDGGGGNRLLNITSERSPDDVAYSLNNQNRPIFTNNNSETYNTKESYVTDLLNGEYARFIAHADSALSVAESSTQFRNQTVTGPAMLWILHEI